MNIGSYSVWKVRFRSLLADSQFPPSDFTGSGNSRLHLGRYEQVVTRVNRVQAGGLDRMIRRAGAGRFCASLARRQCDVKRQRGPRPVGHQGFIDDHRAD